MTPGSDKSFHFSFIKSVKITSKLFFTLFLLSKRPFFGFRFLSLYLTSSSPRLAQSHLGDTVSVLFVALSATLTADNERGHLWGGRAAW